ncbi:hypothetical protein PPYR_04829 [Photinus pyralis]|uniref:WD and tetratricopeptide repeats protein 1 n=2 Tax=Photinus pyralis TaxID=7054 RepID=A0A1Y1JZ81_PHOPY|nr:WD and tetratricopeptide repeats protein 1-like isoform X2 [Photinus pyralis]XP_031351282.1 WD and tetratricopeptide repeats protein 1-like isoform X2 [Photinus pyralis]KAB0795042.1 hypothetical protein PPYR_11881 [Photinus pyralis]KAB0802643.1 hypothetical protein PPYR_04829 [Photinus pyralis]
MDGSLRKTDVSCNIVKLLQGREKKAEIGNILQQHSQFTDALIKRLGLEHELEGHQGCVNCLQWSSDGRRLASGSDDTNVMIWDPFRHRLLKTVHTPHIGNIFSVKFVGSDDSLIATGAGDCRVVVQSVEQAVRHQTPHLDCGCHMGRVKRLATSPDEPLLFWSASEDGLVIQYDMREPHECASTKSKVFVDLSYTSEVKCIAVNPVRSHLIAIGANDCFIRLFDRRMVKTSTYRINHTNDLRKRTPPEPQDPRCVQYFAPGHLAKDARGDMTYKLAATYVTFDSSGSDMLVNMGGEQIYLFDINNPRYVNELCVPENASNTKNVRPCCNIYRSRSNGTKITSNRKLLKCNKKISSQPCACDFIERARTLFNRKWTGDVYSAARDYLHVIRNWNDNKDAYIGLIQCLIALNWSDEAYHWLDYFSSNFVDYNDSAQIKTLHDDIASCKTKKDEEINSEKAFSDEEKQLRLESRDYETHFIGHCNTTTDIKEANFLGENANFICAGSDDGIIFIWDRKTTNIATALWGDGSIVNCVQPHPSACLIATSGIDPMVKLWSPTGEEGAENSRVVVDPWAAIEANQQRMVMDPFENMLANMGYRVSPLEGQDTPTCRTS